MLADAVEARLEAEVAALAGRVKPAADLSELIAQKALPQSPLSAFVVPAGLRPSGEGESAAGAFTQVVAEGVSIVFVLRSAGDVSGAKSIPSLGQIIPATLATICGWAPDPVADDVFVPIGVFRLESGAVVRLAAGVLFYQLDVSCPVQLRIL